MFDNFLFDLDGTLTDPYEGITNSVAYALKKFGIEVEDRSSLKVFIGPPLNEAFSVYCGLSEADAVRAVNFYREYYADKGIFENGVYDGIYDVLDGLVARNKRLIVATSKPEIFTNRILERYNLDKYFSFVAGATLDFSRVRKEAVVAHALRAGGVTELDKTIMIGDRKHDILGARDNKIKSAGVLYGYGDRAELEGAGADYILNCPRNILDLTRF